MPTKQWLQVKVVNEIVMHLLLSFISSLDFKPLFVPIEANLGEKQLKLNLFNVNTRMEVVAQSSEPWAHILKASDD